MLIKYGYEYLIIHPKYRFWEIKCRVSQKIPWTVKCEKHGLFDNVMCRNMLKHRFSRCSTEGKELLHIVRKTCETLRSQRHGELPNFSRGLHCVTAGPACVRAGHLRHDHHGFIWCSGHQTNPKKWLPSDGQWICRFDPTHVTSRYVTIHWRPRLWQI